MRKHFFLTALGLGFSAMASRPARAFDDGLIRLHVPFEFHIAKTTFPSGDYVIRSVPGPNPTVLEIRQDDGKAAMFFMTERGAASPGTDTTRLVFDQYGEEKFLHAILVAGTDGNVLEVSSQESRAALAAARAANGEVAPTTGE